IDRRHVLKQRVVDRITAAWIAQAPTRPIATPFEADMLIFAVGNAPIHRYQLGLELLLERGQLLMDGLGQAGQAGLLHQAVLLLPGRSADQVILETAEAHAVAAEEIA